MELNFDIRGNLTPYETVDVEHDVFVNTFVTSFDSNSSRHSLYKKYTDYSNELSAFLSRPYYQWIDGSFISIKTNPRDIDLVTVIHYQDYEEHANAIASRFVGSQARALYQVDAYIVADYPKGHRKFAFAHSDKLYWMSLFGKTRVNRAKRQYDKGFIQLSF